MFGLGSPADDLQPATGIKSSEGAQVLAGAMFSLNSRLTEMVCRAVMRNSLVHRSLILGDLAPHGATASPVMLFRENSVHALITALRARKPIGVRPRRVQPSSP